ncbi:hypothetical protein TeGR_g10102, partial [Tetraparma gracilis]
MSVKEALTHPFVEQVLDKQFNAQSLTPLIPQIGDMSKFSLLKKNAMMAVAFNMSQTEMEELRDSFCSIDTDHSGTLTKAEFNAALKKVMPTINEEKSEKIFESMDQDGDGEISYLEFLAATMKKNELGMKELQ